MLNEDQFYSPRLRVCCLSPILAPGGAEQHLVSLIRNAKTVDYRQVITMAGDGVSVASQMPNVHIVKATKLDGESHEAAMVRTVSDQLTQGLQVDIFLYWGFGELDLRWTNIPVIHLSHASGIEKGVPGHWEWIKATMSSLANFHVAVSKSGIRTFEEKVREKGEVRVIHNGADVERTRPRNGREFQRKAWGLTEEHKVILFLGRFFSGKGPDLAIRALHHLPEEWVTCCFGWGEMGHTLRKMAHEVPGKNRVVFPLPSLSALGDVYAAADVVVIPSSSEAFPLVMVEAWQAGVPLVCSEFSTLMECEKVYCNGESLAWHVPCPPTEIELAEAILRVDPNDERVLRALQLGMSQLTASAMAARWESFMYDCVRKWHNQGQFGAAEVI